MQWVETYRVDGSLRFVKLLTRALALSAFTLLFLAPSSSAQQSGDAPGWPITNPTPSHGKVIPDATVGFERPEKGRDDGTCLLWALEGAQGGTVSAAELEVPGKAKGQYAKACGDIRGKKLASAEEHLRKAVQEYPQYAAAWVLLGQVLESGERIGEAQDACSQSTTVDASYVPAYLCLADVAGHQKQWNQSLDMADRALALAPARNVYAYFYTANARFHLSQVQQAESNALLAIDADRFHRVPQAHLLLAQVYEAKHDPASEAAQLRAYLKVAPNSPYSASVRKSLVQLEGQIPK
jgi:tetratricopeptide (TPR) repeat protein